MAELTWVQKLRLMAGLDPYDTSKDTYVAGQGTHAPAGSPAPRPVVAAPAPAPKPTAPTATAPTPGWEADQGWQETNAWVQNQLNQSKATYGYELGNLRTQSGLYDAGGNPLDQTRIENLNPFSQAGLLRRSWREAQTGGLNSYAAAGQLYSGALKNAVGIDGSDPRANLYNDQVGGYNSFGYHEGLDSVKNQYNQGKSALDKWLLGVGNDLSGRLIDAGQDARDRFIASRPAPARAAAPAPTAGHGPNQPGMVNVFANKPQVGATAGGSRTASRPPKPNRDPKPGFRWRFVNGHWRQVRKTPSRVGSTGGGSRG